MIDYSKYQIACGVAGHWLVVCKGPHTKPEWISPPINSHRSLADAHAWIAQHEAEHGHGQAEAHSDEPTQPADVLVAPRPGGRFQVCLSNPALGLAFGLDRAGAVKLRDQLDIALRVITDGDRKAGGDGE